MIGIAVRELGLIKVWFLFAKFKKKQYFCRNLCKCPIVRLKSDVNIKNRRASFDYEILDRYVAGIQLYGTEIKSIRENKASLVDTYCQFVGRELWVKQMHIAEYRFGSYTNHEAKRDRKLLMTKKELSKLEKQVKDTGKTIIPLRLFINERGFAKMEIALCQGKHTYDKRQALRAADDKREVQRAMRNVNYK